MYQKDSLSDFGKWVKIRLIELDMTQTELAKRIGTSNVYLSRILRGDRSGEKYKRNIEKTLTDDSNKIA